MVKGAGIGDLSSLTLYRTSQDRNDRTGTIGAGIIGARGRIIMADTEKIRVQLDYPLEHVKEPIIYHLVTDYRLIPNIRRANIDVHIGGMLVLEIEGTRDDLEAGIAFLRDLGITVTSVDDGTSWTI